MPRFTKKLTVTAAAVTIAALGGSALAGAQGGGKPSAPAACASNPAKAKASLDVVGLTTDGKLICFNEFNTGAAKTVGAIQGLTGDTSLVGIDFRPATGELVGLGNAGGIYVVDTSTAKATKKSQLDVALAGTSFGIDFNPTVDRLRVISDTGQNLRINIDTGVATVDGTLNTTTPPAAPVTATGVVGAAYTNNDGDAGTATTLFDIDSSLDQVTIQAPPNAGTLNATGKLGFDTTPVVGSDIHSTIRNGSTVTNQAYASLYISGRSAFYSVDLLSGKATKRGLMNWDHQLAGIAIPLNQL